MPRLLVTDIARANVDAIAGYIARDNLAAALRFYDAAQASFELLSRMPGAGPRVDPPLQVEPNLRFWPIARFRNYLVLYRPIDDGVEVLRVVHGARDIGTAFRQGLTPN